MVVLHEQIWEALVGTQSKERAHLRFLYDMKIHAHHRNLHHLKDYLMELLIDIRRQTYVLNNFCAFCHYDYNFL